MKKITAILGVLILIVFSYGLAASAELSFPKVIVASSGGTVTASVEYRARGAEVSALIFDLAYDQLSQPERYLTITSYSAGSAATAAGKTVDANLNFGPGVARFVIFGLNQNVIADGSLVDLTIQVVDEFPPDFLGLHLFNVSCASPQADFVFCSSADGQILVNK